MARRGLLLLRDPMLMLTDGIFSFARKRTRLVPVYDSVVSEVLGTKEDHWERIRAALGENNHALHNRLLGLRKQAGPPDKVSVLRVLDVIARMEGTHPDSDTVA